MACSCSIKKGDAEELVLSKTHYPLSDSADENRPNRDSVRRFVASIAWRKDVDEPTLEWYETDPPLPRPQMITLRDCDKHKSKKLESTEALRDHLENIRGSKNWSVKICTEDTRMRDQVLLKAINSEMIVELDLTGIQLSKDLQRNMEFGSAINVQVLILDNCSLYLLHPSIGRLSKLKVLSLQQNHLYDLPLTIRLLTELEYINLSENKFRSLPGAVFHLRQLKNIDGLHKCLLTKHQDWTENNCFITSFAPLRYTRRQLDQVPSLQKLSLHYAIGMNCWLIPLPDRYRNTLVSQAITHDLCENCLVPVKRLMSNQEPDGYTIKVCVLLFCGVNGVPFTFSACSEHCKNITVDRFKSMQNRLSNVIANCQGLSRVTLIDHFDQPTQFTGQFQMNHSPVKSRPRKKCIIS